MTDPLAVVRLKSGAAFRAPSEAASALALDDEQPVTNALATAIAASVLRDVDGSMLEIFTYYRTASVTPVWLGTPPTVRLTAAFAKAPAGTLTLICRTTAVPGARPAKRIPAS